MDILKTFVITACLFAAISGCTHDFIIGYPHGCIIDGFSWVDEYTYTYVYKS